jgi:chromosome segregation ATPase
LRRIPKEIKPQLSKILQLKLWPTGHLPFFWAKVEKARQRIEARHSQAPLEANTADRCQLLNKKKAALDAKADTSTHSQRLQSLERELEDLKAKVRATEKCIQDEKDLIARSQQEAENLTAQLKIELTELSILSWQIVSGEDKDDEAVIAEADRVRLEAIAAIDEFLQ